MGEFEDFIFNTSLFLWNILTYGYVAEVLFVLACIFFFLNILFVYTQLKFIKFIIKENLGFFKYYLYMFCIQKYHFLKDWFREVTNFYNKQKVFVILVCILLIVCILGYIFYKISLNK